LNPETPACLYCQRSSDLVPLLSLQYQHEQIYICAQHLPILIHQPEMLAEFLPDGSTFGAAPGHEHSEVVVRQLNSWIVRLSIPIEPKTTELQNYQTHLLAESMLNGELPSPHFEPQRVGEVWKVIHEVRAREAPVGPSERPAARQRRPLPHRPAVS
jgi:hypothetical protein